MANEEQLSILKQGVEVWNTWREENPTETIDLNDADLGEQKLAGVNLSHCRLRKANLYRAVLSQADLSMSNLRKANLYQANLVEANFNDASLREANVGATHLKNSSLDRASLVGAELRSADLRNAKLRNADLSDALVGMANLEGADLSGANLSRANFNETILTGSNLSQTNLTQATFIRTRVKRAIVSDSMVYGINVWDLAGEFAEQNDLIITRQGQPIVTVDNIRVAQFVYLILNNVEVRDVINTLTSKSVLILGRFAVPERKMILDALRNKLREFNLLPIVFDFDRPTDKDFTETIKTLAGLSYFVVADVTNPKSSPLELQATVPDYQIPFVPIIQEGESPFAMMVDLQKKYNWVLNTVTYDSMETLMKVLKPLIIDPAMNKRNELRLIKAQVPEVISGKDFLAKRKE